MILKYSNDGKVLENSIVNNYSFNLTDRDYYLDEFGNKILRFVGFVTNDNDDIFVSFPKHFEVNEVINDTNIIFNLIMSHRQKKPELYIGETNKNKFKTNYPFAAFYAIYDYYLKYGLVIENEVQIKSNTTGKINWKHTLKNTNSYIIEEALIFFPFYYEKKTWFVDILAECMTFAINYTNSKFSVLLNVEYVDLEINYYYYLNFKDKIIQVLLEIRQNVYKDHLIFLVENLLAFFKQLKIGGVYYIKHYSFSNIWEDMVNRYLELNYNDMNEGIIDFQKGISKFKFKSLALHPNLEKPDQFIKPDHLYVGDKGKLIFDAKYYNELKGINYKQISYYLFLKEWKLMSEEEKIYSALILPNASNFSKIHFKMDPEFNDTYKDLIIYEIYLDIKNVINCYLNNDYYV